MSEWGNDFEAPKTAPCPRCGGSTTSPATHYDKVYRDTIKCTKCDLQTLPVISHEAAVEIWDRKSTGLLLPQYQGIVALILYAIRHSDNWIQIPENLYTEVLTEMQEAGYKIECTEDVGYIITWRKAI